MTPLWQVFGGGSGVKGYKNRLEVTVCGQEGRGLPKIHALGRRGGRDDGGVWNLISLGERSVCVVRMIISDAKNKQPSFPANTMGSLRRRHTNKKNKAGECVRKKTPAGPR